MTDNEFNPTEDEPAPLTLAISIGRNTFSAAGHSTHVMQAFSEFQDLIARPISLASPGNSEDGDEMPAERISPSSAPVRPLPDESERLPLPAFLDSKKLPRGNNAVALGIAVWSKRYESATELDIDGFRTYWRDSGFKVPANIVRDLGSAVQQGWLERVPGSRTQFRVNAFGERTFDRWEAADA